MSDLHLAVATDRAYLPYAATTLLSAARATPGPLVAHLQHTADVAAGDLAELRAALEATGAVLRQHLLDPASLGELPAAVAMHGGAISCARFLLPDVLADVDRVLYLDADTLVLGSLRPLWEVDLDGHLLAAVRNVVHPEMHPRLRGLGLAPEHYLNSGVLLMDLRAMRERRTGPALVDCVRRRGDELLWVDQDALNLVCAGAWLELEPRWNAQNSFWSWEPLARGALGAAALDAARSSPVVRHFEGPGICKPWHYLCPFPHTARYRQVLRDTPWARHPLVGRTPAHVLVRRLPRGRWIAAHTWLQRRGLAG